MKTLQLSTGIVRLREPTPRDVNELWESGGDRLAFHRALALRLALEGADLVDGALERAGADALALGSAMIDLLTVLSDALEQKAIEADTRQQRGS